MFKKISKSLLLFVFFLNYSCNKSVVNNGEAMCFSEENFDKVHAFLKVNITKSKKEYYEYDAYEVFLNDFEISFKKDGYSLSKVNKEKGIYSLAMYENDNKKMVLEANQLFCKLLLEVIDVGDTKSEGP